ncbi:MAG: hypothetical protein ACK5KO_10720 [Arachnia sp.]
MAYSTATALRADVGARERAENELIRRELIAEAHGHVLNNTSIVSDEGPGHHHKLIRRQRRKKARVAR